LNALTGDKKIMLIIEPATIAICDL
jgi:hypothetical protein